MARTHKHERQFQGHLNTIAEQRRILEAVGDLQELGRQPAQVDYERTATAHSVSPEALRARYLTI